MHLKRLFDSAGLPTIKPRDSALRAVTKEVGAPVAKSSLSFHSLRHTATTLLHEGGVPAAVAQALIGHDSEAIHQVYVSVGFEALKKAADTLPDVLG